MFEKLKDLVFGFGEFEKTNLEIRFEMIFALLPSLDIKTLRDFEILEETLYKLREQLRIKSSNLNRVARDSTKKLSRKDVLSLISSLDSLKYNFLRKAFSIISSNYSNEKVDSNISGDSKILEEPSIEKLPEVVENKNNESENLEISEKTDKIEKISNLNIFSNDEYDIWLENGKIPYLLLNFKEEISYQILKNLSSIFFETYKPEGTNIIIEGKKALIVPRFRDDKLFNLNTISYEMEEAYQKILSKIKQTSNSSINEKSSNIHNVEKPEEKKESDQSYLDIDSVKGNNIKKQSLKEKEDSLDDLLKSIDEKKKGSNVTHTEKEEESKINIEESPKDERIILEKNKEIKEPEILIEKKTMDDLNFIIYSDDKIIAKMAKDSRILGEILIEPSNSKNISEVSELDLSYMLIFSKAFGSALFDIMDLAGTNIIYDFNRPAIRIVPRFEKDSVKFNIPSESASNEFLEEVRQKAISAMGVHLKNLDANTNNINENLKDDIKPNIKDEETVNNQSEDLKLKAKYLLDSIRKIP